MDQSTKTNAIGIRSLSLRGTIALAALVVCLPLSIGGWRAFATLEEESARHQFDGRVNEVLVHINKRLQGYEQVLHGALGFMASSQDVTREEWRFYVDHLRLNDIYPGIQGVGFSRQIRPHELRSHIEKVRAEGFPDYTVRPEGVRDVYTSIVFLEPFSGRNLRAFGYDMYSEPVRQKAMQWAMESGGTAISGKVRLVQETDADVQPGFLMYLPFYRVGHNLSTIEKRREALVGYVYAPFRMKDLMRGILDEQIRYFKLEIFDGRQASRSELMYDSHPGSAHKGVFTRTFKLDQFGNTWTVRASSLPEFEETIDRQKPLLVLFGGLFMSFLLTGVSWSLAAYRDKSATLTRVNRELLAEVEERQRKEDSLRLLDRAIEASVNAILITDHSQDDNPIVYANPAFERITGYPAREAMGRNCRFLQREDRSQPALNKLRELIQKEQEGRVVLRNYRKDGRLFWNELFIAPVRDRSGRVTHFVGVQNDITEQKNYQKQLEYHATHDALTGMANRSLLQDRIQQLTAHARRHGLKVAVMFVDLDHLKLVNDSMGHGAGDEVLMRLADRLKDAVRQNDSAARIGGDEFVLVLGEQDRVEGIADAAKRVLQRIGAPLAILGREMIVTCSIGVSVYPDDGEDAETLLKNADAAMYGAKKKGRNSVCFYTREMNEIIDQRQTLAGKLQRALTDEQFILHYQPQVNLRTGAVVGVEALIRWQHPELGLIGPLQFIPLAEESGMIPLIGAWVMRTACMQIGGLRHRGFPEVRVSVNLSARQLEQKDLVGIIRDALRESALPPALLEVEITESMVMHDIKRVIELLDELKQIGISIAIDDFGTGYSSLAYLKRLPIDRLKIDKSFVNDVTSNGGDATITMAIISLAHALNIQLTAEGVETKEQHTFLKLAECDEAQGYLYGKPMPIEDLERFFQKLSKQS